MSKFSPVNAKFSNDDKMLEAGEYVVIDPCYVIGGDPFWGELVEFSFPDDETYRKNFFIEVDGYKIFAFSTAHGDGSYPVQDGKNCGDAGVDAGMLSLIPLEYLKKNNISEDDLCLGVKVTLDFDRYPEYDGGNVTCGNINITTNYEDNDDYEDDGTDEDDGTECMCGADDCEECYPGQQYTPNVCEECGESKDHKLVEGEWNCINFCAANMRADYLYDQEKDRRNDDQC